MAEVFWFYEDDKQPDEYHGIHTKPFVRATPLTENAEDVLDALREMDGLYCEAGAMLSSADRLRHRLTLIKVRAAITKATGSAQ